MNGDRTHLLIPIHVDALVVGENDRDSDGFAKNGIVSAARKYSILKDFYLTGPDLRRHHESLDPPLGPGVHLHFRLPAATAHGNLERKPAFPRLPNRWLVQRYFVQGGTLRTKAWLVCSDAEAKDAEDIESAVTLLVSPPPPGTSGDLHCRPTGVARVIWDGAKADGNYDWSSDNQRGEVELTAITGGDAGFSAHYPACRSILGLYDDLADVPPDPKLKLSYLVTGWYSGAEDDPWSNFVASLSTVKGADEKLKTVNRWMEEHGCVRDFGDKGLPGGMLCHGLIKDVRRQADGSALASKPDPFREFENLKEYWVDLGNTSAEAFAGRVARQRATQDPGGLSLLEDLVTALQIGLFAQGSDAAEMDAELHRQGFAAVAGGKAWVIQQASPPATAANAPSSPPASSSLPAILQEQLDLLNVLEGDCDRHERLFRDYRWELYALWHRWTEAANRGDGDSQAELKANLDELEKFVKAYQGALDQARKHRDDARNELAIKLEKLSRAPVTIIYSLVEEPIAPFYAPKDPVLLITGPAAQAKGTRLRPSAVRIRVTGEELQSFSYDLDQRPNQTFTSTEEWLTAQGVSSEYLRALPPWSASLFREALLLDEMENDPPGGSSKKYPKAREKLALLPERPDPFGRFVWPHNPWIPLYLYWEVAWQPDDLSRSNAGEDLKKHWTLKNEGAEASPSLYRRNTDLIPFGGLPNKQSQLVECNGLSFIGLPLFNLQYARAEAGTKLLRLMDQIDQSLGARRTVMISQALAGLHDALMMRRAGDQLPPLDYGRWDEEANHPLYLDPVNLALGGDFHPDSSPVIAAGDSPADTPPFCSLRTGLLQLKDLWIIDAFGQRARVWPENLPSDRATSPSLGQSRRLEAGSPDSGYPSEVRLHPRFGWPMRLKFAGIPAATPPVAAGPICGWVVLNRFDQNLVLYAANGRPVGILQRRFGGAGRTQFYWVAVPGASGTAAEVSGIQNPHLRDFADFVLALDFAAGGRFAELVNEAVEATERRVPEDNQ